MRSRKRFIKRRNEEILADTPLLIPSFSSKGFGYIDQAITVTRDLIHDAALISAYDLHHNHLANIPDKQRLLFIDSGGYEAQKDFEALKFGKTDHEPKPWTRKFHQTALNNHHDTVPNTILVSYDHPAERLPLADQIYFADLLFSSYRGCAREFLVKPDSSDGSWLDIDLICERIASLASFDILGFTEKELGRNLNERLLNLMRIRDALSAHGYETPIHIFGCLDPISIPLFYLAGADIFDGLSWIRFAFHDGKAIYQANHIALNMPPEASEAELVPQIWFENYLALKTLEIEMKKFVQTRNFSEFKFHSDFFSSKIKQLDKEYRDGW
jgi:hypothetical protein